MSLDLSPEWYRSWPKNVTDERVLNRAHISDHLPKIFIENYDYATAETEVFSGGMVRPGLPDDKHGFCMLEWDVALPENLRHEFGIRARIFNDIFVAPYNLSDGTYAHRRPSLDPYDTTLGELYSFALGCIYFPPGIISEFVEDSGQTYLRNTSMKDGDFSEWHYVKYGPLATNQIFNHWAYHLHGD